MSNVSLDMKYGPTLFDLWNDFFLHEDGEAMALMHKARWEERGGAGGRVLPAYEAILQSPDADQIQPWEDARVIIDAQEVIALAPCSCRRRVSGGGMTCKRTRHQVCLNFNKAAEGVIMRSGREISKEEALRAFDRLRLAAERFLDLRVEYLGSVVRDDTVTEASKRQVDFLTHYAGAPCTRDVRKIAARLVSSGPDGDSGRGRFFRRMMQIDDE